jgi:hypothetical protein
MATNHLPYITLDSCLLDYLMEAGKSNNDYMKAYHIAYRVLEQMGVNHFYQVIDVKIPVNANKTVTLPENLINLIMAGRLNSKGEIIPLWHNDKLTTFAGLNPNRLTETQDDSTIGTSADSSSNPNWGYWNGWAYTNIYGTPSGQPFAGSFKVDFHNGVILLDETYQEDYLMLRYVASPQEGQDCYIPVQFREALVAWLWWKDGKAKSIRTHMQLGAARDAKHEFYNELKNAIAAWKPSTIYEKYQIHQESARQAIKT